jgi:hypothetical protein
MVYSKQTNQVRISNQSSPRNDTIDTFLIHHQAGTNDDAVIAAMVSGSRGVSANYTISNEGRITCVVPEERRAWTSGSAYDGGKGAAWDHRAVTVEIENQSAGGEWPISTKALDAAARLLVDLRQRYTIKHVLGHRDLWNTYGASYATFCPGPETVMKIVSIAATTKLAGDDTQEIIEPEPKEEEMTDYRYISGIDPVTKKPRWALSHPLDFPDGVLVTNDIKIASGFAPLSGNSFDAGTDVARWDAFIKVAKIASDAAWAREARIAGLGGAVSVTADLKPVLDAVTAIPAATAKLLPKTGTFSVQ